MSKRLKDYYEQEVVPALMKELNLSNRMEVPRLVKVVVNIGLGDAVQSSKALESGVRDLESITGQKAVITRAKTSVAGFKIRTGMPIGTMVTLRGNRMHNFISKLNGIVLPRVRDFRGLNEKAFDGRGNFNIGLKDQLVFPEIEYDKIDKIRGMNITVVTTAKTDVEAKALLTHLGFPFRTHKAAQPASGAA